MSTPGRTPGAGGSGPVTACGSMHKLPVYHVADYRAVASAAVTMDVDEHEVRCAREEGHTGPCAGPIPWGDGTETVCWPNRRQGS